MKIWKRLERWISRSKIWAILLLAAIFVGLISGNAAAADNATEAAQQGFDMLNNLLPTLIGFFVVMMVFSFIGGFFAGMTRAMNKMQFS